MILAYIISMYNMLPRFDRLIAIIIPFKLSNSSLIQTFDFSLFRTSHYHIQFSTFAVVDFGSMTKQYLIDRCTPATCLVCFCWRPSHALVRIDTHEHSCAHGSNSVPKNMLIFISYDVSWKVHQTVHIVQLLSDVITKWSTTMAQQYPL